MTPTRTLPTAYHCALRAGCTLLARRVKHCGTYATIRYCAKQGIPLELALFIFAGRRLSAV